MSKIKLVEMCNFQTGKLDSNAAEKDGIYLFFTCAPIPLTINNYAFDDDVILLAGNNAAGNFHCQRYKGKFNAYQRTYVITVKKGYDIDYIYYSLKFNLEHFKKISQGSQTKFLTMGILNKFELKKIKYEEQKKISRILSKIDKKIEINNKINSELEAMAKTIYDYWFLQFEFPNEEGKPYKSCGGKMVWNNEVKREIPEGWEVRKLEDIFSFEKGRIPKILYPVYQEGLIPYITIDVANNNKAQFCDLENMILCKEEVIMVMDGAASGDIYMGNTGAIGSTFSVLRIKRDDISNSLLYCLLNSLKDIYKKVNTGSTVPHANKKYIESMYIPLAKNMEKFSKIFENFYAQIIKNRKENQELTSLRDFLLPLLMNGQVGFKEK